MDQCRKSANPAHPQSWNRYSYSLNNPLKFVDPDGREPDAATVGGAVGLAFIPGPQQALVLGVAAVFIDKAIYDNRHEIGETITGVVEGVKDLVSTPGGKATELDQSPVQSDSVNIRIDTFPGLGRRGDIRVEVEVPGSRPGRIQVQRGEGKRGQDTLIYDPKTGELRARPGNNPSEKNRITNRELKRLKKNKKFQKDLDKAGKKLEELEKSRGNQN